MPWTISYLQDLDAILTEYSGVISPAELQQVAAATIASAREHRTVRLLGDCTRLEGGHSIADLYALGQMAESLPLPSGVHEAVVLPQLSAAAHDVQFWETTCRNRGLDVRVFRTLEGARTWLSQFNASAKT